MENELMKYIMPSIRHRRINSKNDYRVKMAAIQLEKYEKQLKDGRAKSEKEIVDIVNDFIRKTGQSLATNFDNIFEVKKTQTRRIDYSKIKELAEIEDKNDIVWIKLNKNGCISVIGTSCDIYFTDNAKKNTSSGKINLYLEQEWNEDKVLIFPLKNLSKNPNNLDRSDIESGIGNYLISRDVPILDYYSHNY